MRKQQVKLNNWPFDEGEQAQLTQLALLFKIKKR